MNKPEANLHTLKNLSAQLFKVSKKNKLLYPNEQIEIYPLGKLNDISIRYGEVGSKGKKLIKSKASVAKVIFEKRKLIKQKEKQGYKRV
ncbi:MAG: hypothetical protein ACI9O4_002269 [Chitinophagales bacterium]|jgi:hypothetical protein